MPLYCRLRAHVHGALTAGLGRGYTEITHADARSTIMTLRQIETDVTLSRSSPCP